MEDDVEIPPETDSDKATDFVDETLTAYNLETIENGLAKVHDGFLMAASSYEDIHQELPNLNLLEIPKMIEQVPIPQVTELSKPLQQLLRPVRKQSSISSCNSC